MENLIIAELSGVLSSFGVGFLAGFAFSVLVFLAVEIIAQSKSRRRRADSFFSRGN
jgi:hypothetical protein